MSITSILIGKAIEFTTDSYGKVYCMIESDKFKDVASCNRKILRSKDYLYLIKEVLF